MTDNLKAILTRVLADEWVPSRVVYGSDEPEGFSSHYAWAEYVADVILRLPGVAVTQLPEPDESGSDNDGGGWASWPGGVAVVQPAGKVLVKGLSLAPDAARDLAAEVLAASRVAEHDSASYSPERADRPRS